MATLIVCIFQQTAEHNVVVKNEAEQYTFYDNRGKDRLRFFKTYDEYHSLLRQNELESSKLRFILSVDGTAEKTKALSELKKQWIGSCNQSMNYPLEINQNQG